MPETLKQNEVLVQVGVTALRAPDGSFLPSVPLYIITDKSEIIPETNMTKSESGLYDDIASILAHKFKAYVDGVNKIKRVTK